MAAAVDFGYKGLILTDHNSSAGYLEMAVNPSVLNGDLVTLHGMEWTTYFGHMLAHDADYDVDSREATVDTIDQYMVEVRAANGLVGIAHPFDIGSPVCTGCHWDYQVKDFGLVNYIEIWNSNQPQEKMESFLAYQMWVSKLLEGYEISCSAGRDWHRPDSLYANMGVTYVGVAEEVLTSAAFKEALRVGSYYITLGPVVEFSVGDYCMGDRVEARDLAGAEVRVVVAPTELRDLKAFDIDNVRVVIWHNNQVLFESEVLASFGEGGFELAFDLEEVLLEQGFVRFEVRGDFRGLQDSLLVVGNPVYVK